MNYPHFLINEPRHESNALVLKLLTDTLNTDLFQYEFVGVSRLHALST